MNNLEVCFATGCPLQPIVPDASGRSWCGVHGVDALADPRREQHPAEPGDSLDMTGDSLDVMPDGSLRAPGIVPGGRGEKYPTS